MLQEGAIHSMLLMPRQPPALGEGKVIGFVICERQVREKSYISPIQHIEFQ